MRVQWFSLEWEQSSGITGAIERDGVGKFGDFKKGEGKDFDPKGPRRG
jgi:hypothetical protein